MFDPLPEPNKLHPSCSLSFPTSWWWSQGNQGWSDHSWRYLSWTRICGNKNIPCPPIIHGKDPSHFPLSRFLTCAWPSSKRACDSLKCHWMGSRSFWIQFKKWRKYNTFYSFSWRVYLIHTFPLFCCNNMGLRMLRTHSIITWPSGNVEYPWHGAAPTNEKKFGHLFGSKNQGTSMGWSIIDLNGDRFSKDCKSRCKMTLDIFFMFICMGRSKNTCERSINHTYECVNIFQHNKFRNMCKKTCPSLIVNSKTAHLIKQLSAA